MPADASAAPTRPSTFTPAGCAGCLGIAIALPFTAFAVYLGFHAKSMADAGQTSQARPFALLAVLMVLGVLVGVVLPIIRARRAFKELDARKASAPEQPWLWRADWASRQIAGSYARQPGRRWLLAVAWNAIALPGAYVVTRQALATGQMAQLLVLAFPVIGLYLLGTAALFTLRATRYGTTVLELTTLPGTIGGKIGGTIRVGRVLSPGNDLQVELACVRRITSGGRYQSTRETTLLRVAQRVPAVGSEMGGVAIPFAFSIPGDAVPSGDQNGAGTVLWQVRARAEMPGVDYAAAFDVPVFRPADSGRQTAREVVDA